MKLERILKELKGIKEELHAIRHNMEFCKAKKVDMQLVEKAMLESLNHPVQLDPNSIARRLQPERNDKCMTGVVENRREIAE